MVFRTRVIVRLGTQNRMVTKGYRKGVYDRVTSAKGDCRDVARYVSDFRGTHEENLGEIKGSKGQALLFVTSLCLCDSVVQCSRTTRSTLCPADRSHEKEEQGQQQRLGQPPNDFPDHNAHRPDPPRAGNPQVNLSARPE